MGLNADLTVADAQQRLGEAAAEGEGEGAASGSDDDDDESDDESDGEEGEEGEEGEGGMRRRRDAHLHKNEDPDAKKERKAAVKAAQARRASTRRRSMFREGEEERWRQEVRYHRDTWF